MILKPAGLSAFCEQLYYYNNIEIFEISEVLLNGLITRRLISPPGKKESPTMPAVAKFRASNDLD